MVPPPASPWRNPRIIGLLALVFLTGAATGALAMKAAKAPAKSYEAGPLSGSREKMLETLNRELQLSPDQSNEIRGILNEYMTLYMSLQAQMDDTRASGKARILRVLNDGQRDKFEKMMGHWQTKSR